MRSSHILTRVILFVILVSLVAAPAPASSQASNDESADKTVQYKVQPQAGSALVDPLQAFGELELNSGISRIDETDARRLAGAADQAPPAAIPNDLGDEYWAAGFGPSGMNNLVRALAFGPDGSLYAGGDFTTAGGATANTLPAGTARHGTPWAAAWEETTPLSTPGVWAGWLALRRGLVYHGRRRGGQ